MSIQLTLAARYMRGRKLRTALTTLAIAFGVMVMFGLNGILPGISQSLQQAMLASSGEVDLAITARSGGTFDASVTEKVAAVGGVAATTPSLRRTVALPPQEDSSLTSLLVVGVEPATSQLVRPVRAVEGRLLTEADATLGDGPAAVVMAPSVAAGLGVGLGDLLVLPAAEGTMRFRVVGLLDLPAAPGADEVSVALPVAQQMFGTDARISEIDVAFSAQADLATVEGAVAAAIGPAFDVGAISSDSPLTAGFQVAAFVMTTIGLFAIAMGGFIILNTFRTLVAERRHDIGMLRAIGASRRTVRGVFLTESLLQGVAGTVIGLLAGWALAVAATAAMRAMIAGLLRLPDHGVTFTPTIWALSIAFGVGVTVLAAVLPARAAARLTPLEALRPQRGDVRETAATKRAWVGLALVVLAVVGLLSGRLSLAGLSAVLVLVGLVLMAQIAVRPVTDLFSRALEFLFRREGGVARANLQRNPARAAVTASTVMVSIALLIALVGTLSSVLDGFTTYLDRSMGADYIVVPRNLLLSAGTVGASPELAAAIDATPGVGDVATLRVASAAYNGGQVQAVGIDPTAYAKVAGFEFAEGGSAADLARLDEPGTVLVNGVFGARSGRGRGDVIALETPEGSKQYRVVGVANDYLNAKLSTVYFSLTTLERDFGTTTDALLLANAADDADVATVKAELERIVARYPSLVLYDTAGWRQTQVGLFDQMKSLYFGLAVILAVPSLLALLNTLAIGVLARTREIGILRAVGSTRRQVRRMVAAEALLLAALGTTAGLIAGLWLGYVLVDALNGIGLPMPYRFPWIGIVLAVVVGLGFSILAALIPARQAARLDIVRALHYE